MQNIKFETFDLGDRVERYLRSEPESAVQDRPINQARVVEVYDDGSYNIAGAYYSMRWYPDNETIGVRRV